MASAINDTVPVGPVAFVEDQRANWAAAKAEIEALQARLVAYEGHIVDYLTRTYADRAYAPAGLSAIVDGLSATLAEINAAIRALEQPKHYAPLALVVEVATLRNEIVALRRQLDHRQPEPPPARGTMRTDLIFPEPPP